MKALYRDRADAGRQLAEHLAGYTDQSDVLVLGLSRGGVPVAFEVAKRIHAPLDVLIVRKLGVPGQEELAMGAIATGGIRILNANIVRSLQIPESVIHAVVAAEEVELKRRERIYRGNRALWEIRSKTAILIDDGIATGSTMRAAIQVLRKQNATRIVVAVPYAPLSARNDFESEADETVVLNSMEDFWAVGQAYEDFSPVSDEEVTRLMEIAGP